jgi:hypothetical protein
MTKLTSNFEPALYLQSPNLIQPLGNCTIKAVELQLNFAKTSVLKLQELYHPKTKIQMHLIALDETTYNVNDHWLRL